MYYFLKLTLMHSSLQDSEGNTPLHCAVLAQKLEAIVLLLEAGADPSLVNFRLFTPLHEAARIGFLPYVKPHPLIKQQTTTPSHRQQKNFQAKFFPQKNSQKCIKNITHFCICFDHASFNN